MLGKSSLNVGDNVFVVQKTKRTPGVITKMNIKKAIVDMNGMLYNVPFSMLELA
jgi:FKBP-type peptidyl-prolyl cis-trans isomerase 2